MPKITPKSLQFMTEEQCTVLVDNILNVYNLHVACHELLGHGVGKLFYKDKGSLNFPEGLKDPLTGEKIDKWY
jgi:hypothetical protein